MGTRFELVVADVDFISGRVVGADGDMVMILSERAAKGAITLPD